MLLNSVTVVITTFNDEAYLAEALASVLAQRYRAEEILVVDDGSAASPSNIVQRFPRATLLRKPNGGLASARNFGLRAARGQLICFLDADDRLEPHALASGIDCFRAHKDVAMVYGGHRRINANGARISGPIYKQVTEDPYSDLLEGNLIGMHATVLYRRDRLLELGAFDETLRRCEDYDVYLRMAQSYSIASHPDVIAEYRWHGKNMSRNTQEMLDAALAVHARHRPSAGPRLQAWSAGENAWKDWYLNRQLVEWGQFTQPQPLFLPRRLVNMLGQRFKRRIRKVVARAFGRQTWPPALGHIEFGSLAQTVPASNDFGWDRGTPVDRYYVENFLSAHSDDIRGRVLEIGDDSYTRQFGQTRVTQIDVLHINPVHPTATLKGSLIEPGVVPEGAFDCVIFTQTLHLIFEMQSAAERLYAALKPGGVLLLTVPGISQVDRLEWKNDWCWSFTPTSVRRLFEPFFQSQGLVITSWGNVFAAICFLFGAVLQEIDTRKLDVQDAAYPVIITLRAQKAATNIAISAGASS